MTIANGLGEMVEWYHDERNLECELDWLEKWLKQNGIEGGDAERVEVLMDVVPNLKYEQIPFHLRARTKSFLIEYAIACHITAHGAKENEKQHDFDKYDSLKKKALDLQHMININNGRH